MPASQPHDSRASNYVEETVFTATDLSATTSTSVVSGYGPTKSLLAQLVVSKATGASPKADIVIEHSVDGTNWYPLATFTQAVAATKELKSVTAPFGDRLRATCTISGTTTAISYAIIIASEIDAT